MDILKFPHPNLFIKCKPVTVFGTELKVLLEGMWDTMLAAKGLGLSSNQVGLDYTMFTMQGPANEKLFIINPKVKKRSHITANLNEGCLSAPGEFVKLRERSRWVEITYQNEKGEPQIALFTGIHAVCVQHEMDHLIGRSHLQSASLPKPVRRELAKKWGLK